MEPSSPRPAQAGGAAVLDSDLTTILLLLLIVVVAYIFPGGPGTPLRMPAHLRQ